MAFWIHGFRFFFELGTIFALLTCIYMKKSPQEKVVFFSLGLLIALIWYLYGSPTSPNALEGLGRFLLEIGIFTLSTVSLARLYGVKFAFFYLLLVVIDLLTVYESFFLL